MKKYIEVLIQCLCIVYLSSIVCYGSPLTLEGKPGQDKELLTKNPVLMEDKSERKTGNRNQSFLLHNLVTPKRKRKNSLKVSRFLRNPFIDIFKEYNVIGLDRKLEAHKATLLNSHLPSVIPEDISQVPDLVNVDGHIVLTLRKDHRTKDLRKQYKIISKTESQISSVPVKALQYGYVKNDQNDLKHLNQIKDIDRVNINEFKNAPIKANHDSQGSWISYDKYSKSKIVESKFGKPNDLFHSHYIGQQYSKGNDGHRDTRQGGHDIKPDDGHRDTLYDVNSDNSEHDDYKDTEYDDVYGDDGRKDIENNAGYRNEDESRQNEGGEGRQNEGEGNPEVRLNSSNEEDGLNSNHRKVGQNNDNLEDEMDYGSVEDEYYDTVDEVPSKFILAGQKKSEDVIDKSGNNTTTQTPITVFRKKRDLNSLSETSKNFKSNKTGRIIDVFTRTNRSLECITPKNESGQCRSFTECPIGSIVNNYNLFLEYMCLRGLFVGICCPDNPVVEISDLDEENSTESVLQDIKQPPEGCGLTHATRIVGGTISVPHQWSWMVALTRRNRFFCGGVIINNWYVLTAAHCVLGVKVKDLKVRLGEYNFFEKNENKHDIPVAEIKRHAMFATLTFQHDIALLRLKRKIEYSKFIGSICLPERTGGNYSEAKATVVGWGTVSFGGAASPVLRQVTVPVWENEDCDRTYFLENIDDSFLCAGSPENGEDACQGDSGGPLMVLNAEHRWEVIGIVSWGRRCGDPTYPGVYTRVTSYVDWIAAHAN